jgi:hypothetical protein
VRAKGSPFRFAVKSQYIWFRHEQMVGGNEKEYEHNICLLDNRQLLGKRRSLGLPCAPSSVSTGNAGEQFRARRCCLARARRINVSSEYHRVEPLNGGVNLMSVLGNEN